MERWHLPTVEASGKRDPQVLFSTPEARAVLIDMPPGDQLGEHSVRERAVLQIVSGRVEIEGDGRTATSEAGTLITFAPHERHTVRAVEHARVLLLLTPWPATDHYAGGEARDASRTPANATAQPLQG